MERPRRRWRRLVVALAILVAVITGVIAAVIEWGFLLHDTATPVSIQDVVQRFHNGERGGGKLDGVYLYATRGGESIDAFGGAHHRYPARTSITAVRVPCGLRLHWQPLEGRSVTWTLCATRLGIELHAFQVVHRFFGRTDRTSYACAGSVLVPARKTSGATSTFRCRSSRGQEAGQARVLGFQEVAVAGGRLRAVHVRTVVRVTGGDDGTETVDWWFDERKGLPVRIGLASRTSRPFFIGDVHYREDADLRLLSMTPLR